ncbi:SGNH/GDSL hydrolase family protein [Streptomyces scopuliridis]|uniref:SGNH hydrolase n=1 Tax=Streptomyces scopuliridis RB72 TaxID=1440053 RepID=A0A2T7T5T6_9ACTN|nr:SGNH/GDSL hydrolase family protein [Streptomyces scopuliridis]PVE10522.1 SGNH hydrolase [Streptomyces scopuliridis RB72]
MTRHRGFALLGALVAVVALVCGVIMAGYGLLDSGSRANAGGSGADGSGDPRTRGRTPVGTAAPASADNWTGTWAAAPAGAEPGAPVGYPGRSIRNVVHTSIGGTSVRITLSNLYSPAPLLIGGASVAVGEGGGGPEAVAGTMRQLSFGRRASVTIPPGGQIVSDPVALRVPYDGDLLVTLHTPRAGGPVTYHRHALQTSYLADGDRTRDLDASAYTPSRRVWRYLTAVDVLNREARGAVVAFGDSITDGVGSGYEANRRWPDVLAARLRDQHIGVLNEGIGGNRVLSDASSQRNGASGLDRFRRDVLDRAGAKVVVIDLGINDILRGRETDPARITAGLRELAQRAKARGLRVIGSTLTPFGAHRGYNALTESVRDRVNEEIRSGRVFDEVVDFDKAVRDPYAPDRIRPVYDSGDGLHPSDAGYRVMGRYLSLRLVEDRAPAQL